MNSAKAAAIFLTGAAIGGAGVYWAIKSPMQKKYEALIDKEVESVKAHYRRMQIKEQYPSPEDFMEAKKEEEKAFNEYRQEVSAYLIEQERKEENTQSVVEQRSIFDKESPKKVTKNSNIYPITYAEFDKEEEEYTKTTLTYYHADDTVVDEIDDIITDVNAYIGEEALGSFGFDPEHQDTVYVRNHVMRSDFEVLYDERSFAKVVEGA